MLFMYFEFIDSGTDVWRVHLGGAKRLITCLRHGELSAISPTILFRCRWLISELLVFDIISSTISKTVSLEPSIYAFTSTAFF
ncbi:uncharacterized protein ATNIH1004_007205 [Aspergillus tanneri]|uniref:Uncharacterized protein n=1 Tax=Aspergillus tanneri TaxID=1220188 RepID=A0A5M9MFN5_9EURO|nr:uncharacterized protein ATNIH1004_007205 [Aspergillus tanneri]KAA8645785.1 hypothetical protein ATNIH1004_007205 [Aspergillus tanneri]